MDIKKIGNFLAQLRKEKGMTQEDLGERLGVTNKTVSRWETGTYLPPVEMLQLLSELYGITINEILSGQRLSEQAYREKAEENIKSALGSSAFTLKERTDFFKKKWKKEHLGEFICAMLLTVGLYVWGIARQNGLQIFGYVFCVGYLITSNNRMMTYVEQRAFDGSGNQ